MTELLSLIKERRSVRDFETRDIPEETLMKILEAVRWSPSWANTQCWEVVVVKDQIRKERLRETLPPGNPASRALVEAPVVFALCGKLERAGYYKGQKTTKFGDWFMFDLGIATQSLSLAAHSLGLGSVVVGLFDHDRAGKALALPAGIELAALIPLGYPARITPAPKRRAVTEFSHRESF